MSGFITRESLRESGIQRMRECRRDRKWFRSVRKHTEGKTPSEQLQWLMEQAAGCQKG